MRARLYEWGFEWLILCSRSFKFEWIKKVVGTWKEVEGCGNWEDCVLEKLEDMKIFKSLLIEEIEIFLE